MSHEPAPISGVSDDHETRVHPGTQPNFSASMGHAVHGVIHVFKHERNARIHLLFAVATVVAGLVLKLSAVQMAVVLLAIVIVFVAEILNTAIERTLDLIDIRENAHIKLIKDMSAGGVLVAAVAAVVVGLAVFGPVLARLVWGS